MLLIRQSTEKPRVKDYRLSRIGINKQQIFAVADQIVANGEFPNAIKIRNILTTGSISTIQKYFKQWKEECLNIIKGSLNDNKAIKANQSQILDNNNFIERKRILEQNLNKQIAKNEYYTKELINAEKTNIVLKEENRQLKVKLQELELTLKEAQVNNKVLERTKVDLKNKLEINDNKKIENMQQIIDDLRAELKLVNKTSLIALRDASNKGHDTLMQEKLNSINLQAKIDNLHKELMDSKKQMHDALLQHQVQSQTLLRQINQQQKVMQEHIGLARLRELFGEQELMLNFNNKPGVAYGK